MGKKWSEHETSAEVQKAKNLHFLKNGFVTVGVQLNNNGPFASL